MSHSSTNLVFVLLDLSSYVQGTTGYKNELYLWPKQLDVKAKACTFPLGAELTVFSPSTNLVLVQLVQLDLSKLCAGNHGLQERALPLAETARCECEDLYTPNRCRTRRLSPGTDSFWRWQPLRLPFMFVLCSNTCRPTRTFRKLLRFRRCSSFTKMRWTSLL